MMAITHQKLDQRKTPTKRSRFRLLHGDILQKKEGMRTATRPTVRLQPKLCTVTENIQLDHLYMHIAR